MLKLFVLKYRNIEIYRGLQINSNIQILEQVINQLMSNPIIKAKKSRKKNPESILQIKTNSQTKDKCEQFILRNFDKDVSKTLTLRQKQMNRIQLILQEFSICDKLIFRVLLITGSSGVGKSTILRQILKNHHNVIKLSGNTLANLKQLSKQIRQAASVHQKLNKNKQQKKESPAIVFVEQIEVLLNSNRNKQQLLDFFKIFQQPQFMGLTKPILIGTSNTINLSAQITQKTHICQKNGLEQIIFSPYEVQQFCQIIRSKIEWIKQQLNIQIVASAKIVTFIATKCSQYRKGDTRTIIEAIKYVITNVLGQDQIETEKRVVQLTVQMVCGLIHNFFHSSSPAKSALSLTTNNTSTINTQTCGNSLTLANMPSKWQITIIALYLHIKNTDSISINCQQILNNDIKHVCQALNISYQLRDYSAAIVELQDYGILKAITSKNRNKSKNQNKKLCLKIDLSQIEQQYAQNSLYCKFFRKQSDTKK